MSLTDSFRHTNVAFKAKVDSGLESSLEYIVVFSVKAVLALAPCFYCTLIVIPDVDDRN